MQVDAALNHQVLVAAPANDVDACLPRDLAAEPRCHRMGPQRTPPRPHRTAAAAGGRAGGTPAGCPARHSLDFAAVLVSPLQRARHTSELAGLGAQAQLCDDLRECDDGVDKGITTATVRQSLPGWTVFTHPCPYGDTIEQIQGRCQWLISPGLALYGERGRLALFPHGLILRSLAGRWLGLGPAGGSPAQPVARHGQRA
jgi:broad specificity phosphatase PhoE